MRRIRFFLLLIFLTAGLFAGSLPAGGLPSARAQEPFSVSLTYFRAAWTGDYVLVEWETATEFDNSGFFVLSAEAEDGNYVPISDFILAEGSGATGKKYSYEDREVEPGTTYWYKLLAIDNNNAEELHGPVSAAPAGDAATPTATTQAAQDATPSLTSSPTATESGAPTPTNTQAPTRTPTSESYVRPPTNTPRTPSYPAAATSTPRPAVNNPAATAVQTNAAGALAYPAANESAAAQESGAAATGDGAELLPPTATLEPLPSVTIEFGGTAVALAGPQSDLAAVTRPAQWLQKQTTAGPRNLSRMVPLALIGLVWALLAGWFALTMRRLD